MRILITGANGLLGRALQEDKPDNVTLIGCSRQRLDVLQEIDIWKVLCQERPEAIIHCAAMTRPMADHDKHPDKSIYNNIIATSFLSAISYKLMIKMIYISTDYVYPGTKGNYSEEDDLNPVNNYGWSKLGGECAVHMIPGSLILRCAFTEWPFPHSAAPYDVVKSYDYVNTITKSIWKVVLANKTGVINIGGPKSTIYDFAKISNPDVKRISKNIIPEKLPDNISLNLEKLHSI